METKDSVKEISGLGDKDYNNEVSEDQTTFAGMEESGDGEGGGGKQNSKEIMSMDYHELNETNEYPPTLYKGGLIYTADQNH